MKSRSEPTPLRVAVLMLAVAAAGCTALGDALSGDKVDYRNAAAKAKPLDVPPDLTQLARDSRYRSQGGVVSASGATGPVANAATAAVTSVALNAQGGVRIERDGQQRWLVVPLAPEQLWPQLRAFWEQRGFQIEVENAQAGVLETNWAEDRAKLPADAVRNTIGRLLGRFYDTGERDRFRMRVERTAAGSEIYISHRGILEIYTDISREATTWRARPTDPQLEAEMLSRLMLALGAKDEPLRAAAAAAAASAPGTDAAPRARALAGSVAALEVDEPFDRAWRRVGLALDRSGFSVEDRDRAAGLYYVRYVDPKTAGKEEPGFWARLMGEANAHVPVRYRVVLKGEGAKTAISVLTSAGAPETGENGQRIAAQLVSELR